MKQQILAQLPSGHPWQDKLHCFEIIDSTNTRAKELARANAPHGTVLIAKAQTGGRGRRGRSFHSPAGSGVYLSVILRPDCKPTELMHLTCAAAVAACDAVEKAAGIRPGIKWTNDLVWRKRKLAGILTELGLTPDGRVDHAIIGIGINCCQSESDFPEYLRGIAGSLESVTGKPVQPGLVAAALIEALEQMSRNLLSDQDTLLTRYRADCITLGQQISLIRGDEIRHGMALDVDNEGALVVQFDNGITEAVNSGEVSVRGMYGYV